jgi:hypothetical protein
MNFYQFTRLPEISKMRAVWYSGVLVAERSEKSYRFELYQLEDFYVEQQVHMDLNVRKAVKAFRCTSDLDKYLELIDVTALCPQLRR